MLRTLTKKGKKIEGTLPKPCQQVKLIKEKTNSGRVCNATGCR